MADAFDSTDLRHLTPEQRLDELTAILATGVRRALAVRPTFTSPQCEQIPLDVSPQTSVHVPVQLTRRLSPHGFAARDV